MYEQMETIRKINYSSCEIDALYHQASLKLGISDSVSIVLYMVYGAEGSCPLREIYKKSGVSKQTVNSAIRKLEADEILYLTQRSGREKRVILTDKGNAFAKETIGKLYEAEMRLFLTWPEEELKSYLRLTEKHIQGLREQIERM